MLAICIETSYDRNVQLILKIYLPVVYGTPLIGVLERNYWFWLFNSSFNIRKVILLMLAIFIVVETWISTWHHHHEPALNQRLTWSHTAMSSTHLHRWVWTQKPWWWRINVTRDHFQYRGIYRHNTGMKRPFQHSNKWAGRKISTSIYQWIGIFKKSFKIPKG